MFLYTGGRYSEQNFPFSNKPGFIPGFIYSLPLLVVPYIYAFPCDCMELWMSRLVPGLEQNIWKLQLMHCTYYISGHVPEVLCGFMRGKHEEETKTAPKNNCHVSSLRWMVFFFCICPNHMNSLRCVWNFSLWCGILPSEVNCQHNVDDMLKE